MGVVGIYDGVSVMEVVFANVTIVYMNCMSVLILLISREILVTIFTEVGRDRSHNGGSRRGRRWRRGRWKEGGESGWTGVGDGCGTGNVNGGMGKFIKVSSLCFLDMWCFKLMQKIQSNYICHNRLDSLGVLLGVQFGTGGRPYHHG